MRQPIAAEGRREYSIDEEEDGDPFDHDDDESDEDWFLSVTCS